MRPGVFIYVREAVQQRKALVSRLARMQQVEGTDWGSEARVRESTQSIYLGVCMGNACSP